MDDNSKSSIATGDEAAEGGLQARLAGFEARVTALEVRVDSQFAAMKLLMRQLIADLRTEMHQNTADLIKWMVGLFVATIAIFVTVTTLMLNIAGSKVTPPVVPAAPVIIQVPPWPAPK